MMFFLKKKIAIILSIVLAMNMSTVSIVFCVKPQKQNNGGTVDSEDNEFEDFKRWRNELGASRLGNGMQRIMVEKKLQDMIDKLNAKIKDENTPNDKMRYEKRLAKLEGWAIEENMYGNAIASGLAGKDYLKVIEDQHITSLSQGFLIGMATRTAGVFGDVLSKRIEGAIDRIVGGVWDAIFVDGWNNMRDLLLHEGNKPFVNRQLKGWRDLVFSSFNDIERLLKDGIQNSLRGRDMTLRENDADATPEDKATLSAWIILIGGYIRQFDYIIFNIEKSLPYYREDDFVVFYAKELQTRLLETEQILAQCKSIRDLDNLIDSNKALISALNKNVINLFSRLMELVDAQQSSSLQLGTAAIMGRESSRRGDSLGGNGGVDDDYSYHSMSGRAF